MIIKSLLYFESIKSFNLYTSFIDDSFWRIEKQLLKNRVDNYSSFPPIIKLKKMFLEKKISIWPLKDEEAITWVDTLSIMRRVMIELFQRGVDSEKTRIIMEYPLKYGNHMRADYLLVYDRLIIVLEFGMFNQDEKRSEERYTKKLQDSINYRQVISNSISQAVVVLNYTMIYKPEYDKDKCDELLENIVYNNQEISLLALFLSKAISNQDSMDAIKQLISIT
jgi:hypothetical protein